MTDTKALEENKQWSDVRRISLRTLEQFDMNHEHRIIAAETIASGVVRAAPAQLAQQWKPIETAPKDGTEILLATPLLWDMTRKYIQQQDTRIGNGYYLMAGWYVEGRWQSRADQFLNNPTHWMPLPALPLAGKGE